MNDLTSLLPLAENIAKTFAIVAGAIAVVLVPVGTIIAEMRKNRRAEEAAVPAKTVAALQPAMQSFGDMLMLDGLRNAITSLQNCVGELNTNVEGLSRRIESGTDALDELRHVMRDADRQRRDRDHSDTKAAQSAAERPSRPGRG